MAKLKKNFYIGKDKNDISCWLYYGSVPPYFIGDESCCSGDCNLIGQFNNNPISESIENNTVVKIYIRKETIKNKKKNE